VKNQNRIIVGLLLFGCLVWVGTHASHDSSQIVLASNIDNDTDENIDNQESYAAAVALAVSAPRLKYQVSSSTPQFVVLSFDGSKSVPFLNETLDFEKTLESKNKSLRFTYFINAAYFLTKDNANLYQGPGHPRGTSNIGFSSTTLDITERVQVFNKAFAAGNEIGSHSAGHFDGSAWSYEQWSQEFNSFATLMWDVQKNNSSQQIDAPLFLASIRGFRAPYLGVDKNLYKVLEESHFAYDTSGVGPADAWPRKDEYGVWHIPLGTIFIGPTKSPAVAMDYNLFKHQSNAKEVAVRGSARWNTYFDQTLTAYTDYFNVNYQGNRAPVIIGEHFSKWNDGVYWEALKTFAEYVCGQPQVRCVTFKELVDYLNTSGVPPIAN
jgi:peptidoglycan/xylan/chitin deacetylase (PgdA/CDA1 family)